MNSNHGANMTTTANKMNDAAPAWLKGCEGVSNYAAVSRRTAQAWLSGGLKARRLTARLVLVKPEWVDAFIESQATERAARRGE